MWLCFCLFLLFVFCIIQSLIHSVVRHSFPRSLPPSTHSLTPCLPVPSFIHSFIHPFIHSFIHSLYCVSDGRESEWYCNERCPRGGCKGVSGACALICYCYGVCTNYSLYMYSMYHVLTISNWSYYYLSSYLSGIYC